MVEGTLADVLAQSRGIQPSAIIGTLAAWQRLYSPICFAGNVETAAKIAESFLLGQVKEIQREAGRLLAACESANCSLITCCNASPPIDRISFSKSLFELSAPFLFGCCSTTLFNHFLMRIVESRFGLLISIRTKASAVQKVEVRRFRGGQ